MRQLKDGKDNPQVEILIKNVKENFLKAMDDNLSINVALASIFDFITQVNKLIGENELSKKDGEKIVGVILELDKVLGLGLGEIKEEALPREVLELIRKRESVRKVGDFTRADEIRKKILDEYKIIIEDSKDGVKWKKV
jgi:cysteinyl-tRNA synthetase